MKIISDNTYYSSKVERKWGDCQTSRKDFDIIKYSPVALLVNNDTALEILPFLIEHEVDFIFIDKSAFSDHHLNILNEENVSVYDALEKVWIKQHSQAKSIIGRIRLFTSGTTGDPKLISHSWDTLFTAKKTVFNDYSRWLVPYQVGSYAWFQLITLGLFKKNQSVFPIQSANFEQILQFCVTNQIDSISSTPTFMRMLLMSNEESELKRLKLKKITLGGEIVTQNILDDLTRTFPNAKLTHIYASSEAGIGIITSDGLAGFPAFQLDRKTYPLIKIEDDTLFILSNFQSSSFDNWINTGDLVEVKGDRIFFIGRKDSAFIKLNGEKILVKPIKDALLEHPSILWCEIKESRGSFGSVICAEYVQKSNTDQLEEAEMSLFMSQRVGKNCIPRLWERKASIPMSTISLKAKQ